MQFLKKVALSFNLSQSDFDRIATVFNGASRNDPYQILGVSRDASDNEIKKKYRELIRENHPDTLIAKGMPQEFIDIANEKMANINAAYDQMSKDRSL